MFAKLISGAVQEVLLTLVLAVLSLGAAYAIYYIDVARRNLQGKTNSEIVKNTIDRAATLAGVVVASLEGTVAKDLREAVKAGNASWEELRAVGDRAVEQIQTLLGDEGVSLLGETVGDVNSFIRDLVEAELEKLKKGIIPSDLDDVVKNSQGLGG